MATHVLISSRRSASTSVGHLSRATGPPNCGRHLGYTDQMIKLSSTNATVSQCQSWRISLSTSVRMKEISKSVGCNSQDNRVPSSTTIFYDCTIFHLYSACIATADVPLSQPLLIGGALVECVPLDSTYFTFCWQPPSPAAVEIPLPISCTSKTTNSFTMLSHGTTLRGSG